MCLLSASTREDALMSTTTGAPTRKPRARTTAVAKPAKDAEVAPEEVVEEVIEEVVEEAPKRTTFRLVPDGNTKSYARFRFPENDACTGTVYVPIGTTDVRVAVLDV